MVKMVVTSFIFCVLFSVAVLPTQSCFYDSDCADSQPSCCSDGICRKTCYYCSYNSDCGTFEKCCANGECIDYSETCGVPAGVIAGIVVSCLVFIGIVAAIVACFFCACCPWYRRRTGGVILVQGPASHSYNSFGVTTTTANAPPMYMPQPGPYHAQPPPFNAAHPGSGFPVKPSGAGPV